jgi:hypothetical protein
MTELCFYLHPTFRHLQKWAQGDKYAHAYTNLALDYHHPMAYLVGRVLERWLAKRGRGRQTKSKAGITKGHINLGSNFLADLADHRYRITIDQRGS